MSRFGYDGDSAQGGGRGENASPRVIIVSDVLLYREGLEASLVRDGRLKVLAAVSSSEAPTAVPASGLDAVLLDATLGSGLALARQLHGDRPVDERGWLSDHDLVVELGRLRSGFDIRSAVSARPYL